MKKNKCNHISFWDIYKVINFHRTFSDDKGREFSCSKCGKECVLKWKGYKKMKKSPIKSFFIYFLWMLPAIILISLVICSIINYMLAIMVVIAYHFGAMHYIINSSRLKIIEK